MKFHPSKPEHEPILQLMLFYAAGLDEEGKTPSHVLRDPALAKYVSGWGRPSDLGLLAYDTPFESYVGAAWLRLYSGDDPAYGFVHEGVPELAIGVLPEYRGRGIGTELLRRLLDKARGTYRAVSLSVRETNPAVRLYERFGFRKAAGLATPDNGSLTMTHTLGQVGRQKDGS